MRGLTERRKRVLQIAGYVALFLVLFAYFLYLGFPYAAITNRVVGRFQGQSQARVEIASIAPDFLTGFKLRDVRVYHGDAANGRLVAKVDVARVRIGLFSLLRGALNLSLTADLYGGNISGKIRHGSKVMDADLGFHDVNLGQFGLSSLLAEYGDFKFDGLIGGQVKLHYDAADLKNATGNAEIKFQNFRLADATIYGAKIPAVVFEPATLKLDLGSRALKVVEGRFKGTGMEVEFGGRMTLRDDLEKSTLSYFLKFKPTGQLEERFGQILEQVKKKERDGFYRVNLIGSLSAPRFR